MKWLLFCWLPFSAWGQFNFQDLAFAKAPAAAAPAGGTVAFVDVSSGGSLGRTPQTRTNTFAAGNLAVVLCKWEDAAADPIITDDKSNTWTLAVKTNYSTQTYCAIYYATNTVAGATIVTVDFGLGWYHIFDLYEFSGASISSPLDVTKASQAASGTAVATGTASTANNSEALLCVIARYASGTVTPQASWTETSDISTFESQHFITTSSGSYQGSGTISSSMVWAACFAAFK